MGSLSLITKGNCTDRCGEGVFVCRGGKKGVCHMICEKQEEKERLGEGAMEKGGGLWGGIWLLLAAAVADGGQSLVYCHSLTGQITSEHFLTGQVQNP